MKKITSFVILLFTLTTGIYSNEVNPVRIAALKGPTGLSMVNLIHENKQLGGKAEYSIINTPQLVTSGLLSGSIDIAALPTNLAAIIFNKKPDFVLAAVTGAGTLYVLSSRDDIKTWSDLKGKTVYNIARSSTPGFLFNHLVKQNNIDPAKDMNVDFKFNHVELAPMLIAGKVDTGVLPEPLVTKVLLKNKNMRVVLDFQTEYSSKKGSDSSYPLSCVVVRKSLVESNPEFVRQFLVELEDSINWVKANPYKAGEKGETVGLGVTGTLISKAMPRLNLGFKNSEDIKTELNSYYKVLFNSDPKSVGGKLPTDSFYMDLKKVND